MTNSRVNSEIQKVLRQNKKSLDEIQQHVYDVIILNQLTNSEVAALFTALLKEILTTPHNLDLLERIGIDSGKLNPETVTKIQQVLTEEWLVEQGLIK